LTAARVNASRVWRVPLPRCGVSINRQLQQLLRHVRLVREEVEACADPRAVLPAPANRHRRRLLAATLDALGVVGPLPQRPTVHLDAGYDWTPCREVLAERGMVSQIATRGVPATTPRVEGSGRTVLACPTPSRKRPTNQPGTRADHWPASLIHGRLRWLHRLPLAAWRHATVSTVPPGPRAGQTARPDSPRRAAP
jgi:hypothetical protein